MPPSPTVTTTTMPARKRRRVTAKIQHFSVAHIDVLTMVCMHFQKSPRHIFLMMKACKGLRANLDAQWWARFWAIHQACTTYKRHHYLSESMHGTLRPQQYAHILRLVYGLRCERCSARWHHRVIPLLKLRLCPLCLKDNLISNHVLWHRYGLRACDVIEAHGHLVTYFPLTHYKRREQMLRDLTNDPIDTAPFEHAKTREMMFLWRPDLASLYDLPALQAEQRRRIEKTNRLKACIRRLHIHLYTRCQGRISDPHTRMQAAYEAMDGTPLRPSPLWIAGSPYFQTWIRDRRGQRVRLLASSTPQAVEEVQRKQNLMAKMRSYAPRPLLGFSEVCAKTWLEKFEGHYRPPVPDGEEPRLVRNMWQFSRNVYDVRTLRLIAPASSPPIVPLQTQK